MNAVNENTGRGQFSIPPDLVIGRSASVLPLAGEVNWGMTAFAVEQIRSITDGKEVISAGVDTGIDRSHPLLSNCFAAKDFLCTLCGFFGFLQCARCRLT